MVGVCIGSIGTEHFRRGVSCPSPDSRLTGVEAPDS